MGVIMNISKLNGASKLPRGLERLLVKQSHSGALIGSWELQVLGLTSRCEYGKEGVEAKTRLLFS